MWVLDELDNSEKDLDDKSWGWGIPQRHLSRNEKRIKRHMED